MALAVREVREGVAIVKLNRPEKRNAINLEMAHRILSELSRGCEENMGVVLTGEGDVFSAGLDLAEVYSFKSVEESSTYFKTINNISRTAMECPKPVVAFVNGHAIGYGMELLYFVDYVVAVRRATFSVPGIRYGLMTATPVIAPALLGLRARNLLDWEFKLTSEEAASWGLVQKLVDNAEEGLSASIAVVKKLADIPNFASIKRYMKSGVKDLEKLWLNFEEFMAEAALGKETKSRIELFLKRR